MIKELEDYNWFPKIFRRFQLEFIGSVILWSRFYQPLVPVMKSVMSENNIHTIQDLCSGSGMPAVYLQQQLKGNCTTLLSDKFPESNFNNTAQVIYLKDEVDVLRLIPQKNICYTMYNAFHHFDDAEKQQLMRQLQQAAVPFVFAEILAPDLFTMIKVVITGTVLQLLSAPFVQPFSLLRLLFTYIIPVNLFTVTYDGILSVLKSRSAKQYRAIIQEITNENYIIAVDTYSSWKGTVICLKGNPKK